MMIASLQSSAQSCECEVTSCSPCQRETNIEFYTAKCADGSRVKSCSKPVCVELNPLPSECSGGRSLTTNDSKMVEKTQPAKPSEKTSVGTVLMSTGDVQVFRDSSSGVLKINSKVFNGDNVVAGENGKVKIIFTDNSIMTLLPKTKTLINHQPKNEKPSSTVIGLMYGTVRSVVSKSETNQKKYKIETPTAVAGVRGTDFLTTYYEGSQITKVQTIEGSVELSSLSGGTKTVIPSGHYASYVVDTEHDNNSASMKYVDTGFITPLGTINPAQVKEIEGKFDFESRDVAANSNDSSICTTPEAQFNQCSYECLNNPKNADHCRTNLKNVKCVRRRCNANGKWAEETRLPASFYEKCPANGIVVDRCDY